MLTNKEPVHNATDAGQNVPVSTFIFGGKFKIVNIKLTSSYLVPLSTGKSAEIAVVERKITPSRTMKILQIELDVYWKDHLKKIRKIILVNLKPLLVIMGADQVD